MKHKTNKDYKCELYHDNFQNFRRYGIPKAQLVIADIPYNLSNSAYASSPSWYIDGDNKNGESDKAGKQFFNTDINFNLAEYMHFCSKMLKPEPKEKGQAPAMIVFCSFEQMHGVIEYGKKHGFKNSYPLFFIKNYSSQVLKANMRIVGATEHAVVLYREKLPKFNNNGKMIFNWLDWDRDNRTPKIHPCLPKGEKVFANNKWVSIEDVKVGDNTTYGEVVETTSHKAEKIIHITAEGKKVKATYNHPFLIMRGDDILWLEAEKILNGDYLLMNLKLLLKDISESEEMVKQSYFTSSFGKKKMDQYQKAIKFITEMETKQIIELKTLSLSTPLHISGCTQVASLGTENGINSARLVKNIKNVMKSIGIIAEDGLMGENARNVIRGDKLENVLCVGRKIENVREEKQEQTVYNLTINGIPAFDTKIGISHNTQKPVPLLKRLISIFTDEGDVVIDPVAGSGTTLKAAAEINRNAYGFEVDRFFYKDAKEKMLSNMQCGFTI